MANPDFSINPNATPDQVVPANAPRPLRPTGVPQSKKEFKKVMGKDQSEEDDDEDKSVKDAQKTINGKGTVSKKKDEVPVDDKASIFTLSSGKKQVAMKGDTTKEADVPEESVDELASKGQKQVTNFHPLLRGKSQVAESPKMAVNLYTAHEKKDPDMSIQSKGKKVPTPSVDQPEVTYIDPDEEQSNSFMGSSKGDEEKVAINPDLMVQKPQTQTFVPGTKEIKPVRQVPQSIFTPKVKEHAPTTKFSQEQPDLAYVNPMRMGVQATSTNTGSGVQLERPSLSPDMLKLIDHMVEQITTLTNEGKTDTSIILKNPPMFDGANLKLTSFDSARGEFNISFENLKPEALRLLQGSMDSLKMAMNDKGFTVHIMTATTIAEAPIYTADSQAGGERRDRDEEQQQGQQRQQREEEQ